MAFRSLATLISTLPYAAGDTPGYPGARFVALGEPATIEVVNRGYRALAENTDFLRDAVNRDIGLPVVAALGPFSGNSVDIDPSGGALGDINYTGTLYLGEVGWTGQERLDQLFQILDEDYHEVVVDGVEAKVTGLTGNALGDEFVATLTTLNLNVTLPSGNYRIGYYEGTDIENLPPWAFTHAGLRGLEEVSGELKVKKARLEIAELNAFDGNSIDVDPNAGAGGDYDLNPAGYLYLGGTSYSGGGQEERDFLFQVLNEDYSPVVVGGVMAKVSSIAGTGAPALGGGFWNTDVVTLNLNVTLPTGNYRLLLGRNDNVTDLSEDGIYKGVTRYAHDHPDLQGFTATLTDGTNSSGGDFNGVNAVDGIDSYSYGGRFILRPGNYEWNSATALNKPYVTVIGELKQFGANAATDITSIEIPTGAAADFRIAGHYENLLFSSKNSSYEYTFRSVTLRDVTVQAGMAEINGFVDWRNGGNGLIRSGNSPSQLYGILVKESTPYKPSGIIESCFFEPPDPGGLAAMHIYALTESTSRKLLFRKCVFDGQYVSGAEGLRLESSSLDIRFEDCQFLAGDGEYALNADFTLNNNITFVNCTFYNDYGTVAKARGDITFDNCKFISGSSGPTAWAEMLIFTGGCKLRNCTFEVGTSSIETNPASATGPLIIFGDSGGVAPVVVDDLSIVLPDTWHGWTPIYVYGSGVLNEPTRFDDVRISAGISGGAGSRTTGLLGTAAVIEFNGYTASPPEFIGLLAKNLQISNIGTSASDSVSSIVNGQGCIIDGLAIDGITGLTNPIGATNGLLYIKEEMIVRDLQFCPSYAIPCSGAYMVKMGADTLVDGGRIHRQNSGASRYTEAFFGSIGAVDHVGVVNMDSPKIQNPNPTARLVHFPDTDIGVVSNNVFNYFGGSITETNPMIDISGSSDQARVTNNTVVCSRTVNAAVTCGGASCIVDGNIIDWLGGGSPGAPAISNTGTDSVTGTNVLAQ